MFVNYVLNFMRRKTMDKISREQVAKVWRGEWDYPTSEWNLPKCPKCGCNSKDAEIGNDEQAYHKEMPILR